MGLVDSLNGIADRLDNYVETERAKQGAPTPMEFRLPRPRRARPGTAPPSYRKGQRHTAPLQDEDVDSFIEASGQFAEELKKRHPPQTTPTEREQFILWLGHRHPNRTRRIGRDFDWLRDQAKKYGIPPEDVRWLL